MMSRLSGILSNFGSPPFITWFISHTHLDHVAALPIYIARRRMMKMDPPTIYLPETAVDPVQILGIEKGKVGQAVPETPGHRP